MRIRDVGLAAVAVSWLVIYGYCQRPGANPGLPKQDSPAMPDPTDAQTLPKTDAQWKAVLTPQQYKVTRKRGTEPAFSGQYWDCHKAGIYRCVCCGATLFASEAKFDSGCGWPSFSEPLKKDHVASTLDTSHFMRRIEVHCSHCGAHLGHVFDDGPQPTGLRYCINSLSLKLDEKKSEPPKADSKHD